MFFSRHILFTVVATLCIPVAAHADFAVIDAERIASGGLSAMNASAVSRSAEGDSVVVFNAWKNDQLHVFANRISANVLPMNIVSNIGSVTQVDTSADNAYTPDVSVAADGRSAIVWVASNGSGSNMIRGRLYNSAGTPEANEFQINSFNTTNGSSPTVARAPNGNFTVAWIDYDVALGSEPALYTRRYAANGAPLSDAVKVSGSELLGRRINKCDIAMDAVGNYAIVYSSSDGSNDPAAENLIHFQIFGATGVKKNAVALGGFAGNDPAIAMKADGGFRLTWSGFYDAVEKAAGNHAILSRAFDQNGTAITSMVRVNLYDYALQNAPDIAMAPTGDYVISWTTPYQDGSETAVYARRYYKSGLSAGPEFRLNMLTDGFQDQSAVAMDADGNIITTWTSSAPLPGKMTVSTRRYRGGAKIGLSAALTSSRTQALLGETITYSATMTNLQVPQHPTGVTAIDVGVGAAPRSRLIIDLSTKGKVVFQPKLNVSGNCVNQGQQYICTLERPLRAGQQAKVDFSIKATDTGNLDIKATAAADSYDPYLTDNSKLVTVVVK